MELLTINLRKGPEFFIILQDIVTRYATATGHHCTRRFGWDCHGLPVEYEIDKKLGKAYAYGGSCAAMTKELFWKLLKESV